MGAFAAIEKPWDVFPVPAPEFDRLTEADPYFVDLFEDAGSAVVDLFFENWTWFLLVFGIYMALAFAPKLLTLTRWGRGVQEDSNGQGSWKL